ncbi:antitoxin [Geodermatophilus sp. URMC 65]
MARPCGGNLLQGWERRRTRLTRVPTVEGGGASPWHAGARRPGREGRSLACRGEAEGSPLASSGGEQRSDQALDRAGQFADEKTGGKYDRQTERPATSPTSASASRTPGSPAAEEPRRAGCVLHPALLGTGDASVPPFRHQPIRATHPWGPAPEVITSSGRSGERRARPPRPTGTG